jgi:SET domain-containing protein
MVKPLQGVRVGKSTVSGKGLFATRAFHRGERIVEYTGKLYPDNDDCPENRYLFSITKKWVLDGSPKSNIGRWANHSCGHKTNAWADVRKRSKRVWLTAWKRINPGDEILYNYGKDYREGYLNGCCACPACRERKRKRRVNAHAQ